MAIRTNYQTVLTIDTATPISEGKMRPDGGDIRIFKDAAQTTPLDFYIDPTTLNTTATKIYIKQDLPTGRYHPGIAFYAPLDETSGTHADIVGGKTGTITGGTQGVAAQVGLGVDFDGTATHGISWGANSDFAIFGKTGFSEEMWVYVRSITNFPRFSENENGVPSAGWRCGPFINGSFWKLGVVINDGAYDARGNTTNLNYNQWYHLAWVWDSTTNLIQIYIDGVPSTGPGSFYQAGTGSPANDTARPFTTGRLPSGGQESPDAIMDNIAIYHRRLTEDEIRSSYLRGRAGKRLQEPTPSAHWTFNSSDNAGSEVVDLVSGLNGAINGTVTVGQQGRIGQGFDFDGSTGYVSVTDDALMEPHIGGSGTSTWFGTAKIDVGSSFHVFCSKTSEASPNEREFLIFVDQSTNALRTLVQSSTGTNINDSTATVPVPIGKEFHWALVFDMVASRADRLKFYLDGVLLSTTASDLGSFTGMTSTAQPLRIGTNWSSGSPTSQFDGIQSELGWSNAVLTDAQIAELARRSKEGLRPDLTDTGLNLLAYWSFDNRDIGINPQDASGNSNHGTVIGNVLVGQPGPTERTQAVNLGSTANDYYIRVPDNASLAAHVGANGVMTLSAWVKPGGTGTRTVVGLWDNTVTTWAEFYFAVTSTGGLYLEPVDFTNLTSVAIASTGPNTVPNDQWSHVAVVWDNSQPTANTKASFFINGIRQTSNNPALGSFSSIVERGMPITIGRIATPGALQIYEGDISQVLYFPEALSDDEVLDLYNKGRAGFNDKTDVKRAYLTYGNFNNLSISNATNTFVREITGLVHSYQFDEENGGDVLDNTGGITGSISGSVVVENGITGLARKIENSGSIQFSDQIIPTGNASLLLSFRTTNTDYVLLSNYDGVNTNTGSALEVSSSGVLVYRNSIGAGSDNALVTGSTRVDDGKIHTVIITKDNSNINLYLDSGSIEGTAAMTSPEVNPSTSNFVIGGYTDGTKLPNVSYDELRVFNKVLTTPEVQDLMDYYPQPAGTRVQVRERADPEPSLKIE